MSDSFNLEASSLKPEDFDAFYRSTPPWEIGVPQPAFAELWRAGRLRGRVLDVGCGTGEHALMVASGDQSAVGVDASPTAIGRARSAARDRGVAVQFIVGDVLELPAVVNGMFDTIVDSAVFHVFNDVDRALYVESLAAVVQPGGQYFMLGFSDQVPGTVGPRRLSEPEIRQAFADGWVVDSVEATHLQTIGMAVPALLLTATRGNG